LEGKICLVTGANSGIGRAAALALAKRGVVVAMVGRHAGRLEAARDAVVAESGGAADCWVADLSSQREVRALAHDVAARYGRLDVLVNNAGVMLQRRRVTADGLEMTFAVNHLAGFLLTNLLLDALQAAAPARVVNVASNAAEHGVIDFDDLQGERGYTRRRAYNQSKLANVLFTCELARRLEGTGVTANCVHPGHVWTNLGGMGRKVMLNLRRLLTPRKFAALDVRTPAEGADAVVYLAASPDVAGISGKYWVGRQPAQGPCDVDAARRLWAVSEILTGLDAGGE
jgi:NAD(P)-dependent dehydrogenase (short-subunit alcohol dehydrogenase family)